MRDREFGAAVTPAHDPNHIIARLQPHAITALVGSVFLSLIASLVTAYLAVVMPSFDVLFRPVTSPGPAAQHDAPEPWFGAGAFSAAADNPPVLPVLLAPVARVSVPAEGGGAPARAEDIRSGLARLARGSLAPPLRVIAGAPPHVAPLRPADLPARLAVAEAAGGAVLPAPARPAEIVTIAASMSAPAEDATARRNPVEEALAALALPTSPRPQPRPAVQVARAARGGAGGPAASTGPAEDLRRASLGLPDTAGVLPERGEGRFSGRCSPRLARAIPRRPGSARDGRAFVAGLSDAAGGARDAAVVRALLSGNVPGYLRRLVPVTFAGTLADGRQARITICVMPDYLAVGSDRDHVRVPLGLRAAGRVAEAFDMMLPTTRMVDAIYAQAAVRLVPQPMPAGGQMVTTGYFLRHNATIERQLVAVGARPGVLVAGQKKDLVLTNRLASSPGRVAIYGWHRPGGRPIQPLSTVHGAAYADYSHGIRLVSRTAYLNGRPVDLEDLLMDGRYARLLNREGPIGGAAIRIAAR